jgi:MerR family transcriptional regulator, light-induced transcriptional regulator
MHSSNIRGVDQMPKPIGFPIGVVSTRTGLSRHVIRAWERRYEAITPQRSDSRRRLYTSSDIERLVLLKRAIRHGYRISTIAGLGTAQLSELVLSFATPNGAFPASSETPSQLAPQEIIDACMDAVAVLDGPELNRLLQEAAAEFSHHGLLEQIIAPLMEQVGRRWSQGDLRIVHAHGASVVVHAHLMRMLELPIGREPEQPCLLMATPAGQRCCLGALAICIIAQDHGWTPIFLGTDLPAEEIAAACDALAPQMLALSITCRVNDRFMADELIRLSGFLEDRFPMVIGGQASHGYHRQLEGRTPAFWATTEDFLRLLQ